jgi:hypothetical protein
VSNNVRYNARQKEGNMSGKAIYLGKTTNFKTDARLYRLIDPPFYSGRRKRCYVIVSGADLHRTTGLPIKWFGISSTPRYETFIFKATRKGKCVDFAELEGSFKGSIDHEEALRRLGYEVIG